MHEHLTYEPQPNPLMDAWDAVPRGPAIFIATCDNHKPIHGTWVNIDQPEAYFHAELDLLLSEPDEHQRARHWVVLDQIGIGEPMLPEQLSLAGLHQLLAHRHRARP